MAHHLPASPWMFLLSVVRLLAAGTSRAVFVLTSVCEEMGRQTGTCNSVYVWYGKKKHVE